MFTNYGKITVCNAAMVLVTNIMTNFYKLPYSENKNAHKTNSSVKCIRCRVISRLVKRKGSYIR
jgi:hypothetical protein